MADQNLVLVQTGEQTATEYVPTFEDFWLLYPRRVAKLAAQKAWSRLSPTDQVAAIVAAEVWRRVWRDKDPEYIPHAATWLNGRRFEDELPPGFTARPPAAANGPMRDDQPQPARTPLPDHVRALLGRLKAKL